VPQVADQPPTDCPECDGQGWLWRPIQFAVSPVPKRLDAPVNLDVFKERIVCRCAAGMAYMRHHSRRA
jgi:hypothetical protein